MLAGSLIYPAVCPGFPRRHRVSLVGILTDPPHIFASPGIDFHPVALFHEERNLDNLPEPDELAEEIIENLEAGLESFRAVLAELEN